MNTTESKYYLLGQAVRMRLMGQTEPEWETLFEGTVTTTENDNYTGAYCGGLSLNKTLTSYEGTYRLVVGDITINKTSAGGTGALHIGNGYLLHGTSEDTGEDFFVSVISLFGLFWKDFSFYSRNPGTYNIKIERMVN